ncbi:MAG: methylenetetrahydrofolate reductase [Deltaproteobacteria bacterium]|uniref:Methylenetetrahydrofolate reductase n=1 Tax=Candidatus Zymogenus saltonus TaxID=2844893 RepID=A0A9D8PQ19_9DELT|nr:methylenetetrahydrofolate reductase [Candidatus Zymogenus saltonus]
MSKLQESLEGGKFTFTGEIGPPKGNNVKPALQEAEEFLKGNVAAVNVTDIQTAVMRVGSFALCIMLREMGIEPIMQMGCRDRNRLALQSDLLNASIFGIENILSITGDHIVLGDHRDAKPVFDLDSVSLLRAMTLIESGTDMGRTTKGEPNVLDGVPKFFKGCVSAPCAEEVDLQVMKLEKKVAAGAQFVQTQAVFDLKAFEAFMKKVEHLKVPILAGIVILKGAGTARYMNKKVPGVTVPDKLIERLASAEKEDVPKVTVQIAGELIHELKDMCQGAHIMSLGWGRYVPAIIEAAKL